MKNSGKIQSIEVKKDKIGWPAKRPICHLPTVANSWKQKQSFAEIDAAEDVSSAL